MNSKYYIAEASWSEKLVKNRAHPQWVHIINKEYQDTMEKNNSWGSLTAAYNLPLIQHNLYNSFGCQFTGVLDYKGEQDYMDVWPKYRGAFGVISHRVKLILDSLHVSAEEFVSHTISIKNANNLYYLMFIYQLPMEKIVFEQSVFYDRRFPDKEFCICSTEEFYDICKDEISMPFPKQVVLKKQYSKRHIIAIQGCPYVFFSEELVNQLKSSNIIGLEFISSNSNRGGDYTELSFI